MRKKDNETIEGESPARREEKPNATAAARISLKQQPLLVSQPISAIPAFAATAETAVSATATCLNVTNVSNFLSRQSNPGQELRRSLLTAKRRASFITELGWPSVIYTALPLTARPLLLLTIL
jgi:hypothetical protein